MNRRKFIISCGALVASFSLPIPKFLKLPIDSHELHVTTHLKIWDTNVNKKLFVEYIQPGIVAHINYHARHWDEVKRKNPQYFK